MGVPGQKKCLHMQWKTADVQRPGYNMGHSHRDLLEHLPRCCFESKDLIMRFNFALHFVQFLYHFKDRLSFSSCFSVGRILVGSWMSCGIYLDIFIYLYIWVWTLTFLIHPPLWACMASGISEPWHISVKPCSHMAFTFLFTWSQIPEGQQIICLITTMHQTEQTASASSFRAWTAEGTSAAGCTSPFFTCLLKGIFSWQMHEGF